MCCPSPSSRTAEEASPFARSENAERPFSDDLDVSCSCKLEGGFTNAIVINVSSATGGLEMGNRNQNDDPCANCKHIMFSDVRHHGNPVMAVILAHTTPTIGCSANECQWRKSASVKALVVNSHGGGHRRGQSILNKCKLHEQHTDPAYSSSLAQKVNRQNSSSV